MGPVRQMITMANAIADGDVWKLREIYDQRLGQVGG
jgi:hypothetical protein